MSDSGWWIEIVFLAMLAGFIALRLVNVLGKRTGHEQRAGDIGRPASEPVVTQGPRPAASVTPIRPEVIVPAGTPSELVQPLQAIAEADRGFTPQRFLDGAKGAYRLILEAYWRGDIDALAGLVSDEVLTQFRRAAAMRDEGADAVSNALLRIANATLTTARMNGSMAELTVRFEAEIAGEDGKPAPTVDVWSFSRHVNSSDPGWLLVATDDED